MTLEEMQVRITADISNFKKGMKKVQSEMQEVQAQSKTLQLKGSDGSELKTAKEQLNKIQNAVKQAKLKAGILVYTDGYEKTKMKLEDLRAELGELKRQEDNLQQSGVSDNSVQNYQEAANAAAKLEKELEKLQQKRNTLESSGKKETFTQDYTDMEKHLQSVEEKYNRLLERKEKFEATGRRRRGSAWTSLLYDLEEAEKELQMLREEKEWFFSDNDEIHEATNAWMENERRIEETRQALEEYRATMDSLNLSDEQVNEWNILQNQITSTENTLRQYQERENQMERQGTDTKKNSKWKSLGSTLKTAKSILKQVGNEIKKVSGAFASLIHRFNSGISKIAGGSRIKDSLSGVSKSFSNFGRMVKTTILRMGIRAMISGLKESLDNLAIYSDRTNDALSTLTSALLQLRNALVAAFSPILTYVTPALETLISYLTQAVTALGQFFAAFTGQDSVVIAKKVQVNYRDSLDSTTKSTDKAKKAAEEYKNELLSFDEINKLSDQSKDNNDDGDTDSANTGLSPSDMFDTVSVESKFKDLADKIKEAWRKADFTEIGVIFGNKVNEALENIPWDSIQATTWRIARSIATFLNGGIETIDWTLVGRTISQGVNTAFLFVDTFAADFHWDSFGTAIGNGINGALGSLNWGLLFQTVRDVVGGIMECFMTTIQTVDWTLAGQSFANVVNLVIEMAYVAVTNFDPYELGSDIAEFLNQAVAGIDWQKAGETLSGALEKLLITLNTAVSEFDWANLGAQIQTFLGAIDWKSILGGIAELVGGIVKGNIQSISQSSTLQVGTGVLAVVAVFNNLNGIVGIVGKVKGAILPAFSAIKNHMSPVVLAVTAVIAIFADLWTTSEDFRDFITSCFGDVKDKLGDSFDRIKTSLGDMSEKFGDLADKVYEFYEESGLKDIAGVVLEIAGVLAECALIAVLETITLGIESVSGVLGTLAEGIGGTLDAVLDLINTHDWGQFVEDMKEVGANLINGIIDGIKGIGEDLWECVKDTANKVIDKFKEIFGIHSPSTEMASIGGHLITGLENGMSDESPNLEQTVGDISNGILSKISDVKDGIGEKWDNIKEKTSDTFSSIKDKISEKLGDSKKSTDDSLADMSNAFNNNLRESQSITSTQMGNIRNSISSGLRDSNTNTGTYLTAMRKATTDNMNQMKTTTNTSFSSIQSAIGTNLKSGKNDTASYLGTIQSTFSNKLNSSKDKTNTSFSSINQYIKTNMQESYKTTIKQLDLMRAGMYALSGYISGTLQTSWHNSFSGLVADIGNVFRELPDKIKNGVGDLTQVGAELISKFIAGFQSIHIPTPHFSFTSEQTTIAGIAMSVPKFDLQWFAGGGFPETGQMFVANEAGPELVGQIGSRTAVANQDQIVDAVAQGVAMAVAQVMGQNKGSSTEVKVTLEGDSKKLFKVVKQEATNYSKTTGKMAFS